MVTDESIPGLGRALFGRSGRRSVSVRSRHRTPARRQPDGRAALTGCCARAIAPEPGHLLVPLRRGRGNGSRTCARRATNGHLSRPGRLPSAHRQSDGVWIPVNVTVADCTSSQRRCRSSPSATCANSTRPPRNCARPRRHAPRAGPASAIVSGAREIQSGEWVFRYISPVARESLGVSARGAVERPDARGADSSIRKTCPLGPKPHAPARRPFGPGRIPRRVA